MIEQASSIFALEITGQDHIQGPENAEVTLVEYGDFECPHCAAAFPIVEKLRHQQGENLRFVYRHFPLSESHPNAQNAAEAAEAAGAKDLFWPMHQLLFENQTALAIPDLVGYAEQLGVDAGWFKETLVKHLFAKRVREDFIGGVRSGVNGTPTFFINGIRHDGSASFAALTNAVSEQVNSTAKKPRKAGS